MENIILKASPDTLEGEIQLERSKSISNRLLIMRALSQSSFPIHQLSGSEDTQVLTKCLSLLEQRSDNEVCQLDVGPAGTAFRFLTAYLCTLSGEFTLTGSERMLQRPIAPLVESLRKLGAQIEYFGEEGYPPLSIKGGQKLECKADIEIPANMSSQYISALCLIAPYIGGIRMHLSTEVMSKPYIDMTLQLIKEFGVSYHWEAETLQVSAGTYIQKEISVEAHWSSASYFYALAALYPDPNLLLKGLSYPSIQGDSKLFELGRQFGIKSTVEEDGIRLKKDLESIPSSYFEFDFREIPDLAQTFACLCANLRMEARFSGLDSLKIKETNRIKALANELGKYNVSFYLEEIKNGEEIYHLDARQVQFTAHGISTYEDHRMALAFSSFAKNAPVEIIDAKVVGKSFPSYWEVLTNLGFTFLQA